ncbi:BTB/POZ domain-containing protein 6-like isoform X2 [Paramacrobiotus metropolitanus]|nr:BTB/POZ domain-containing protein 6-like isoform X2 [Paramacrobiotus metropolitanus]
MVSPNPSSPGPDQPRPVSGIVSCIKKTFASADMSDVEFAVGRQFGSVKIFPAHRYIFSVRSTVFYTMFYGSLPEKCDEPIDIPDFIPAAFGNMLR